MSVMKRKLPVPLLDTTRPLHAGSAAPAIYAALIVYASLFPASDWRMPDEQWWTILSAGLSGRWSRADVIANVLAYIPLGLLLLWRSDARARAFAALASVTLMGTALSVSVECLQLFLPSRVSSFGDVVTNTTGTFLGACLGVALRPGALPERLDALCRDWFATGRGAVAGAAALVLWILSQWSPFVPSIDFATIRDGVSSLRGTLRDWSLFRWSDALAYALNISGLGLLAATLLKPGRGRVVPFAALAAAVLFLKVIIVGRGLSLEALCGLALAVCALALFSERAARSRIGIAGGAACVVAGFGFSALAPGSGASREFNWIPFAGAIENNLDGFANILAAVWPFVALAFLSGLLAPNHLRREVRVLGALAVGAFVFALEWTQQLVPGRHGDITSVLLAVAGWTIAWRYVARKTSNSI
jgi:VanZ family protein